MKGNTLTVGKPAGTDKGRLLKKRIKDNWQLYAMLLVPVVLTSIYKYIPMPGLQLCLAGVVLLDIPEGVGDLVLV